MISAKEAREMSCSVSGNNVEIQLGSAEKNIKKAAREGLTKCFHYEHLCHGAIERLSQMGYSVTNYAIQLDGATTYLIEW